MATKTCTAHGSAQLDTSVKQIGTASGKFAATTDYVSIPDDADWDFGSGDFTWEMWVRTPASPSGYTCPMTQVEAGGAYMGFNMHFSGSDNLIWASSPDLNFSCSKTWSSSTWYHIAVCRSGNTWYLFIDGVQQTKSLAYGSYSATLTGLSGLMYVGQNPQGFFGNNFTGWIDEVRIQKGEALYTANFTPPASALTANAHTVLLMHMDGTNGSTSFIDSSVSTTAYTLALAQGSFALTGQTTILRWGRFLTLVRGLYTLTGQAVALAKGKTLVATQGSYTLSGQAVTFKKTLSMLFGQGSYALTGQNLLLKLGRKMLASQGSYTYTGFAVLTTGQRKITIGQGSYTLTGETLLYQVNRILRPVTGVYSLTGSVLRLLYNGISVRWTDATKHSTSFSNNSRHSTTWVDRSRT